MASENGIHPALAGAKVNLGMVYPSRKANPAVRYGVLGSGGGAESWVNYSKQKKVRVVCAGRKRGNWHAAGGTVALAGTVVEETKEGERETETVRCTVYRGTARR